MIPAMRRRLSGVLALLILAVYCLPACADAIPLGVAPGTTTFHDGVLVRPSSFNVDEFISSVAGTVQLSVQRINWGDLLTQLSTTVSLPDQPDLKLAGNAAVMFDVAAGEHFSTSIYAQASGTLGYAAYQMDLLFLPSAAQVPLPAAGWLLLSGLAVVALVTRRRRAAPAFTAG